MSVQREGSFSISSKTDFLGAHPDRLFGPGKCSASAEFFSSEEAATKMREQIADECMHEDRSASRDTPLQSVLDKGSLKMDM